MQTVLALQAGATVQLHRRFDPAATLAAIRDHRITTTVLVPAQLAALADHPDWPAADLSSLRLGTPRCPGGAPGLIAPAPPPGRPGIRPCGAPHARPRRHRR